MSEVVMESCEIYTMTYNPDVPWLAGYVYDEYTDDTHELMSRFIAPEYMGETISLRAVAPWIPMHPKADAE